MKRGIYRDTLAVREERAAELTAAIEHARQELNALDEEAAGLSARWREAIAWVTAPPPGSRFRIGVGLGLGFVFLLPFVLFSLLTASGVPAVTSMMLR